MFLHNFMQYDLDLAMSTLIVKKTRITQLWKQITAGKRILTIKYTYGEQHQQSVAGQAIFSLSDHTSCSVAGWLQSLAALESY